MRLEVWVSYFDLKKHLNTFSADVNHASQKRGDLLSELADWLKG